jgi:hypothetical protein
MTDSRGKPILRMVFEVVLISIGVFLGLAGDQWREDAQHRQSAEASLHRFRSELQTNRKSVSEVSDYHAAALKRIRAYLATDPQKRNRADVQLQGLQPAVFEQTAWDLALSTQSLTYIDPDLAFALSKVYNSQQQYIGLTRGILQAMYLVPLKENFDAFVAAADTYFSDVVLMEPKLVQMYDEVIPLIDRELER